MISHTTTPNAAPTTSSRHDHAAAVRMPGATASSPARLGASNFGRRNIGTVYESVARLRPGDRHGPPRESNVHSLPRQRVLPHTVLHRQLNPVMEAHTGAAQRAKK